MWVWREQRQARGWRPWEGPGLSPELLQQPPFSLRPFHPHLQVEASLGGLRSPTLLFKTRGLSSHSRIREGRGLGFPSSLCLGCLLSPFQVSENGRWMEGRPAWWFCDPHMCPLCLPRCVRPPVDGAVPVPTFQLHHQWRHFGVL